VALRTWPPWSSAAASRPARLLLDGGDTWQGSATALWTNGQDMVDACKLLGVDVMTGHWEFTYGMKSACRRSLKKTLPARSTSWRKTSRPTTLATRSSSPTSSKEMNGVPVAIIGQAFPYTPIANPRYMVPNWTFGIQDDNMQKVVDEARSKGAQAVVVISHNGMDVDLKMASARHRHRRHLGGHTHDGMPVAHRGQERRGQTLVTNAGSNGKFLGVLDFDVRGGKVADFRYKLLPVFANMLPADKTMDASSQRSARPTRPSWPKRWP
jgi:sulfur-oxidizing protein SoxB